MANGLMGAYVIPTDCDLKAVPVVVLSKGFYRKMGPCNGRGDSTVGFPTRTVGPT